MYFKITNEKENHNGSQYKNGLNEGPLPFAEKGSCVAGGICFYDEENVCEFISYGCWIREVTIPEDVEVVKYPNRDEWRASKVILGERKSLKEVSTWKWN